VPDVADYVIGVDGGNSKTEVVVASTDGELLARTRGPGIESPHGDAARWRDGLIALVDEARRQANVAPDAHAVGAAYFLANVDLPAEHDLARRELAASTPADLTVVYNDTLAVLRAGGSRSWGVAVVSGAGINAVGVHPDGHTEGFLALGDISGDVGGGQHLGIAGLGAAVRAYDCRGPATALMTAVPAHFGLATAEDVAIAVHYGDIAHQDLHVLAPLVLATAAAGDAVARGIRSAFADEVATMATTLIRRLHVTDTDVEVVLGGGLLRAGDRDVLERVVAGVTAAAPRARVSTLDVVPVYGALVEAFALARADRAMLPNLKAALAR
jgi:N-acetylglucosamine kinase-like BadF-type ATPase